MEFTQDKRETDPLITSVLNGNWPSGCLFLEHILTYQFTLYILLVGIFRHISHGNKLNDL